MVGIYLSKFSLIGGPGRSPTCDLRVRSALLYATELPGQPCQCNW